MKKIIIATNEKLDRQIKSEIEIKADKIVYKEAILELLEVDPNVDYIIFSEDLMGNITNEELIENIGKCNKNAIIYIITKKKKNFINKNRNLIKNKNLIIIESLDDRKIIELFQQETKDNNIELNKEVKSNKFIESMINRIKVYDKLENNRIISIVGAGGVGKSITTLKLAKYFEIKNKKVLIIDLDIINASLSVILGNRKIKGTRKVSKNIDLLEYNNELDIIQYIRIYETNYDYILIDTSSLTYTELKEKIMRLSDINILLVEPNLVGIKKANVLLSMYIEKWCIEHKKIKIVLNKYNKYSVKPSIIKLIFSKFKIIGRIRFNEKYDLVINRNKLSYLIFKNRKSFYRRIRRRINNKIYKLKGERILWS